MRHRFALLSMLALCACGSHRIPSGGETITYRTGPCFGTCPVYTITLGPDGQGIFRGERHTSVTGERRFTATPEQVRAFRALLQRYRPKGRRLIDRGEPGCREAATDNATIDVHWQVATGQPSDLRFYLGCDIRKNRAMADALLAAPGLLPVTDLIGEH